MGDLINTLVHSLKLLLLGMEPATTCKIPQDIDNTNIQLVAHSQGLVQLLAQVRLHVVDLVHDQILESLGRCAGHLVNVLLEEAALALPVGTLGCGDSCTPFLEKCARKITYFQ